MCIVITGQTLGLARQMAVRILRVGRGSKSGGEDP